MGCRTFCLLVLVAGCASDAASDSGPATDTEAVDPGGSEAPDDDDRDDEEGSDETADAAEGSSSGGEADAGTEASSSESSGGPAGLSPFVSWQMLLDDATSRAAAINPSAALSGLGAAGVRGDGTVDLSDVETDGHIELRFWQDGADTGVSVRYGISSWDPEAETYEPSAYPINGNAFASAPLWGVETLPSFAEIAAAFEATPGCGAFTGDADDGIWMRVDWFTGAYIEVSAYTATADTTADADLLDFGSCE